jgi:hypothetical protein
MTVDASLTACGTENSENQSALLCGIFLIRCAIALSDDIVTKINCLNLFESGGVSTIHTTAPGVQINKTLAVGQSA